MTYNRKNIKIDKQVFNYNINDISNSIYTNDEFINDIPNIECNYVVL